MIVSAGVDLSKRLELLQGLFWEPNTPSLTQKCWFYGADCVRKLLIGKVAV